MADVVMTDGRVDLVVSRPSPSGIAALERLGWTVKSRPAPEPKPKRRRTAKTT